MPIYEYECGSCKHQYETMVRIGAEPPPCPECASSEVRKLISQSAFILKGGGWYKDHYGLKKDSGSKSGDGTSGGAPAKSDGGSPAPAAPAAAASTPASTSASASTPAKA